MNRNSIIFIGGIAAVLIFIMSYSAYVSNKELNKGRSERIGKNVLADLIDQTNGVNPIINKSLQGKTVVINVWATWCQPCLKEIPDLNELKEQYADRDDIVFIALDGRDSTREVKTMTERNIEFKYDLYFNQEELIDLLYQYKLDVESRAIPLNLLINKQGKLEMYYMAYRPEKLAELKDYLAQQ